jgi:glycosyltransferase involved in cell wall biosynthesis
MKFSIIMCTWDRANILPKTINSILNQTYEDFELLIMDDGSTDHTQDVLQGFAAKDKRIRLFKHDTPKERIVSRKELMKEATGDWIYWVDSDDEIIYCTLEILKHNIELYPEYKMFNFGQIIFSLTGTTIKLANELPEFEGEGHYHFDSGLVGTGGFTFKRECLDNIIEIPDITEIYTFADWFGERVEEWFDKNDPGKPHQKYNQDDKFCGNPWGDDYVMVWVLTRKYKSKKIPINPYIAYIRTENFLHERATISGTMLC